MRCSQIKLHLKAEIEAWYFKLISKGCKLDLKIHNTIVLTYASSYFLHIMTIASELSPGVDDIYSENDIV